MNLYPERTSNPDLLPKAANEILGNQNVKELEALLNQESSIVAVLCAWGNLIDIRRYLRGYADQMLDIVNQHQLPLYAIGITAYGNPYHASPTPMNRFLCGIEKVQLSPFSL